MTLCLQDCHVSETTGFLLENPLATLPEYFEPWNRLAAELPQLVTAGSLRQQVLQHMLTDGAARLDTVEGSSSETAGPSTADLHCFRLRLARREQDAIKVLPACVAMPLHGVSRDLGLMPILGHADLGLANYRLVDPTQPLTLDNMRALHLLSGGKEGEWFVTVTVAVELAFAGGVKSILAIGEGVRSGDENKVTDSLVHLSQVVSSMQAALSRMHENLSSSTFFNKLRPFLGGWGGEDNPLPDGLIYEGVSDQPIKGIGGSAAQSGTMQVLDCLMGVRHSAEKDAFLLEMRSYMLPAHQRFIARVESQSPALQNMVKNSSNPELKQAFNNLLSAVVRFRSYHIQIVTKYVVQAASQAKQEDNKFDSLDNKGTGGTDLLPFLKELRRDTTDQMVTTQSCSLQDSDLH